MSRRYSRCSRVGSVLSTNRSIPSTAASGVRISWLTFARKSPFAWRAVTACCRATARCPACLAMASDRIVDLAFSSAERRARTCITSCVDLSSR